MSPYRQASAKPDERGPRWGATRWAKFWTKHKRLERVAVWSIVILIVVPIRTVMWTFGALEAEHPFDF